jgi:hypothetical protein
VQRWERELALPVHRPHGAQRSAVMAFPKELDAWANATPVGHSDLIAELTAKVAQLELENESLRGRLSEVASRKAKAKTQQTQSTKSGRRSREITRVRAASNVRP